MAFHEKSRIEIRGHPGHPGHPYHWDGPDLVLNLKIQPRASKAEFSGPLSGTYKVRLTAPPLDGRANNHLRSFLAKAFHVSKSEVAIEAGEKGRQKRVRISSPKTLPSAMTQIGQ